MSGILALVAAGVVIGNLAPRRGLSETSLRALDVFWSYVAFLLNSAVFLLIGLNVALGDVAHAALMILATFVFLVLGRAVAVYGVLGVLRAVHATEIGFRLQHVAVWGGIRGAIAVALALSLPGGGYFDTLRAVAYGVVLLSLVVQGATIHPLSSRLAAETQARR
jgi:CPA1 family monovalent cation:H+ antiporter